MHDKIKTILFIAPGYYGFNEVIFEGLKKYSGYKVIHINSTSGYQYKNFGERVYNFFLKTFTGKNIKKIKRGQHIMQILNHSHFGILLINRPDTLTPEQLKLAISKCQTSIGLFWDSIEKIPQQKDFISKFDACHSFDSEDCVKYGLKKITNFYFIEEEQNDFSFDVAYLATYDSRMADTLKIFAYLKQQGLTAKGRIFAYKSNKIKEEIPQEIEIVHEIIPFKDSYRYYMDSKIILDIAHPHQKGLSFRPFEALGLNKKLITTNAEIMKYDFYDPRNVFVIKDINHIQIPQSFFRDIYYPIPDSVKQKYHIKNWIKSNLEKNE